MQKLDESELPMTVEGLRALVQKDIDAVNTLIVDKVHSQIGLIDDISTHILQSGGKRLRPLVVLLASRAFGYQGEAHIMLAAMVEFFHTATLLHDDVVDDSTLRRGRKTANAIWGNRESILVGDYLYTQANQLLVSVGNLKILDLFAKTFHEISCGEVRQLLNRHNFALSIPEYLSVIREKTALLFAACAAIGPLLCDKIDSKDNLYSFGLHLGNAFQLIDDALDYSASAEVMGKNIGDDLADGKITLPLLHALEKSNPAEKQLIITSIQTGSREHLSQILSIIQATESIEFTKAFAEKEIHQALGAIQDLPNSIYRKGLEDLAHFVLERSH